MKKIALILCLASSGVYAQAFTSPPVTLQNGQTAYGSDVMTDLNTVISSGNAAFTAIAAQIAAYTPLTVPPGMIIGVTVSTCPSGWVPADGTHSTPDLRGRFIRVWNNTGIGVDAGRAMGSVQGDAIQNHTHGVAGPFLSSVGAGSTSVVTSGSQSFYTGVYTSSSGYGAPLGTAVGSETRPANYSIYYCMKTP